MTEEPKRHHPAPVAQAFVVCRQIFRDERTGEYILLGPLSHAPLRRFPQRIRLSVYVQLTGGHGQYALEMCMRDANEEIVFDWHPEQPLKPADPLLPHKVTFQEIPILVPRLGRYTMALLANGVEIAQQRMWFGPRPALYSNERQAGE